MSVRRIPFQEIEWESPEAGMRFKVFRSGEKQLRLVEFSSEFVEADWCEKGHAGYVLEGTLEIDFHGHKVIYEAGDGILIPAGLENGHKGRSLTPITTVILFEE